MTSTIFGQSHGAAVHLLHDVGRGLRIRHRLLLKEAIRDLGGHIGLIKVRVHAGHRLVDGVAAHVIEGVRALSQQLSLFHRVIGFVQILRMIRAILAIHILLLLASQHT